MTATRFLEILGAAGGALPSTDDVLAAALPLLEQVAELHERGQVAPLEGVEALFVFAGKIWFETAHARAPRFSKLALERVESSESDAFEVASHRKKIVDRDGSTDVDLRVVEVGQPIVRPCYVTRYVSWEHEVGHHDPLTDIFVLGLVLASLALDQNLGDADALSAFVERRSQLVETTRLHPVVARAIVRMTEADRRKRVQDLPALIATLKTYREQGIASEEIPLLPGEGPGKKRATYARLRDKLFDFSKRNRMLYFSPTSATVNLTLGSVPLVLDVKSIPAEALLTWKGKAAAEIASTKPVPLGRYLRFEDYPFLLASLDQLRLEANRSKTELGFSPLRLCVCFFHWHNLKEAKEVRISSPLLLLPVALEKKKGVRDAVVLTASSDHAEVNPVLRQYLAQIYGLQLPESVDVSDPEALERFSTELVRQVHASEPGVTVTRVDKPRIDLILAQAKKNLDAYRKRVPLSGRTARSHRGFDYSYARKSFHPLGIQLFTELVFPSAAPNRELHETPRPRIFAHSPDVVEKSLYSLKEGGDGGGPYAWSLDFCSVTLANFNYRKMSLVRDYASLLESDASSPSMEALFSDDARPLASESQPLPVPERFEVMPADPTQASAIARARDGASFIVQGPPGTGKSQTITNLVADFVARGKRVLFVCEKRAAIDVVYHRLKMQGLAPVTSLIHDSQTDKKAFIKDLKETYESWIVQAPSDAPESARRRAVDEYAAVVGRAERFRSVMDARPSAAPPIGMLLGRAMELVDVPPTAIPAERLPSYEDLFRSAAVLRSLEQALRAVGHEPVFARHPLRALADGTLFAASPLVAGREDARALLLRLEAFARSPLARIGPPKQFGEIVARLRLLDALRPLIAERALRLLDGSSAARAVFTRFSQELEAGARQAAKTASLAVGWLRPLPTADVATALVQAERFESSLFYRVFGWLSPAWWRLRTVLQASFDFSARAIRPPWTEVLRQLHDKQAAEQALADLQARASAELGVTNLAAVGRALEAAPAVATDGEFQRWLLTSAAETEATELLPLVDAAPEFSVQLERLVRDPASFTPQGLGEVVTQLSDALSDLPAFLEPLRNLAASEHAAVAGLVRAFPVTFSQLERDVCRAHVDGVLRGRAADVLGGGDWDGLREDAIGAAAALRRANGEAVVARARHAFLENVRRSSVPADALSSEEKKQKKAYVSGRKELEHEFGKTMRFRAIRDLATGNPGEVVRDLKPVWLMSPLSVADTLPFDTLFDVVIFDEASQIPLEDAIPAAYRAKQVIVVGDEMQLPPTEFFGRSRTDDAEDSDAGYELDARSLLSHAARTLPATMLGWHYRSRDEALIAFSNRVFYQGKLLTVPSVSRATPRNPIVVAKPVSSEDADASRVAAAAVLERSVSFHRLENSPYEQRRNAGEARYIAGLVRGLLETANGKTLGVVAFSEAQQAEITSAIRELTDEDAAFAARYEAELEREEDGQFVGLFVKNLENVQGDERDIMIISVCYGPAANGRMIMNFGPINKTGGEKRLNVIFSRAKHHIAVVSSIAWTAITNEYNDGANCLRNYLRYAEALSQGASDQARLALHSYATREGRLDGYSETPLETQLAQALRARGYEVDLGVGTSEFRCNLGLRRPGEDRYPLGILVDDAAHQARPVDELLEAQASVLKAFGWRTLTVLHHDWYAAPELVLQRIETAMTTGSG